MAMQLGHVHIKMSQRGSAEGSQSSTSTRPGATVKRETFPAGAASSTCTRRAGQRDDHQRRPET